MPKSKSAHGACSRLEPQPKLSPGNQHLGIAIGRLVEDEIRILAAVILVALLGEETLPRPVRFDGLQILLRNDHVGVDIDDLQGRSDAFQSVNLSIERISRLK